MMNCLESNLGALRRKSPELAARIESVIPDPQRYRLIFTPGGQTSLEVALDSGERILWHSRYDPVREAERELSPLDSSRIYVPYFAGIGLGYSLRQLWDHRRDEFLDVLILERDPAVFRLALEVTRLDDILGQERVHIMVGEDLPEWQQRVKLLLPSLMSSSLQVIPHAPSLRIYRQFYTQAWEIVQHRLHLATAEFDLMIRSGPQIQQNLWMNLIPATQSLGICDLQNFLSGKPAVVVAAGPSLDRNVHLLRGMEEACAILVVDTALGTVLRRGIQPHIVVSTDPTELNLKHFENLIPPPETLLAYDPEVYYEIPHRWRQRKLLLNLEKAVFTRRLEEICGPFGYVPKGGSVGHTAFYLARALGANPIIFVGLDLAFNPEGGTTHTADAALTRRYGKISTSASSATLEASKTFDRKQEQIVWVRGTLQESVPTSPIMALYIQQFREEFQRTSAQLIDATEGGAWLEGTEIMPLETALSRYADPQYRIREKFRDLKPAAHALDKLINELDLILNAMTMCKVKADEGLKWSSLLLNKTDGQSSLIECREWIEMETCFSEIYYSEKIKIALEQAYFAAVYQFVQKEKPNQTDLRLVKYHQFFESILSLHPVFYELIKRIREHLRRSS